MLGELLAIEDDEPVCLALKSVAEGLGLSLRLAHNGLEGLALGEAEEFSLLIVDLGLPGIGGMEICRRIRSKRPNLPIIILTSKADELNKVLGLELGADDYVTKPFSIPELKARAGSILRRMEVYNRSAVSTQPKIVVGQLSLDASRREVFKHGTPIALSRAEYAIVEFLFANAGKTFTREQLSIAVWGFEQADATVTTHLSRVRQKIEDDPENPQHLTTIRGVGYRFADVRRGDS